MASHPFLLPASLEDMSRTPLRTPRLVLRPVRLSDAHSLWDILSEPEERRHLGQWLSWVKWTQQLSDSETFAEGCVQEWEERRAYRLAVTQGDDLVGMVGLEQLLFAHRQAEVGYWLRKDACGQGLGAEAVAAVLAWAFTDLNAHKVKAAVGTGNARSERLLLALGFQREGCARHAEWCEDRWLDHDLFGVLEHEFGAGLRRRP